ncbi:EcsC family protein [Plectonema radiosum NIES-515]|uniref:EcsC family protein n=1 Tax=Plectonema radiosum NIES-515 TaxID=2986073 RepID=A0ABT3ASG1_9CYAN|nr:EcsC family protein [Plectonema radiosum]MCV3212063.1 EcsC family protein [Plectonema radiosum NIES-515]
METKLTQSNIEKAFEWLYQRAINGIPGFDSAPEMAQKYLAKGGSLNDSVNDLIKWQIVKAGTSGFVTGLGGLLTLPITVPANFASVIYVHVTMIAAIAYMGGYDLKDDKVKTLIYACLVGNSAKDILKESGIIIGRKLTESAIKNISKQTLGAINKKVGFKLVTKFSEKGTIVLGRAVPFVGGVIGASIDGIATQRVGNIARETFIVSPLNLGVASYSDIHNEPKGLLPSRSKNTHLTNGKDTKEEEKEDS